MIESFFHANLQALFDEYRNLFSLILIEWMLAMPMLQRRYHFKLRAAFGIGICFLWCCLIFPMASHVSKTINTNGIYIYSSIWYTATIVLSALILMWCFSVKYSEVIWILLTAYASQHLVYALVTELLFFGVFKDYYTYLRMIIVYFLTAILIFGAVQRIFAKVIYMEEHLYIMAYKKLTPGFTVFFIAFLASTYGNQHNALVNENGINYLSALSDIGNCVFVIIAQYTGMRSMKSNHDKQIVESLLSNEKMQYEAFKRSVDYINIKAHDLKHEIQFINRNQKINTARLEEIMDNISLYESFVQTGNETIDIILTDKNLVCQQEKISFSYMTDADALSHLQESDLYSLFGNMFDNALEQIRIISNQENKFIRLFIKKIEHGTIIRMENYIESDHLEIVDGLPKTTKKDKRYHGFGVKSMRTIAEKYRGRLSVSVENHIFSVNCFIPF